MDRVRELLERRPDPFTRELPDHVTASAVVSRADGSAFLLVHHRQLDVWLQPGGHVEPKDPSVLAAAIREAREETGLDELEAPFANRVLDVDVHEIPSTRDRPAHTHYDVRYLLTTSGETTAVALDEVHAARWFSFEEASGAKTDESVLRALRKARELLIDRARSSRF